MDLSRVSKQKTEKGIEKEGYTNNSSRTTVI
jgi:hypothetical protein